MRIKQLKVLNFRGYKGWHQLDIDDLTALIGRNDAGKSSLLDAIGIFFDHKLCKYDASDKSVYAGDDEDVVIGCVFEGYPDTLTLDAGSQTTLADEYLLNAEGELEIHKMFANGKGQGRTVAVAVHPTAKAAKGLLKKKNDDLKAAAERLGVTDVDKRSNADLRRAIYGSVGDLKLEVQTVPLSGGKEADKQIWDQLQVHLPHFALFRADRPSTDEEAEVQDPMKDAVAMALTQVTDQIEEIKARVRAEALDVAQRTLSKLAEIDEDLAKQLEAKFKSEPKWDGIFKLSLTGDDAIPVNKRGSGVRRLILFSFFRAEAERRRDNQGTGNVIYAVEEPETSQHPDNQAKLIQALVEIVEDEECQALITTHVPGLAKLLPVEGIRYVTSGNQAPKIHPGSEEVLRMVAKDLGVLPHEQETKKVIVCMEGPHDVAALKHFSSILHAEDPTLPDIVNDRRIAVIPLGGGNLDEWVSHHYLRALGIPEIHIYDRDDPENPPHQRQCDAVNARGDGSFACLTTKRELENYYSQDLIRAASRHEVPIDDWNDVAELLGTALGYTGKRKHRRAKEYLCKHVLPNTTVAHLRERGADGEATGWLVAINERLN